jgi:hypothetical protein
MTVLTDAVAWVRSGPERFFPGGNVSHVGLLAWVAQDIVSAGGTLTACVVDDWWLVSSDARWLSHPSYSVEELFRHVVTASEQGRHSMRGEVIVAAFAASVAVFVADKGRIAIQGDPPGERIWSRAEAHHYSLLFR